MEMLQSYSNVSFNETGVTLSGSDLIEFLKPHDAAVVALERLDATVLDKLPNLRTISKYGVGLDNIDLHAAARRGIRVGWRGGVNRRSVAELVIALAIAGLRGIMVSHQEVRKGVWQQYRGRQVSDSVVGLIGFGHVGQEVARLLSAFGATVLACDVRDVKEEAAEIGVLLVGLEDLLCRADVVSLHVPLTPLTANMIGINQIASMRPGAVLINTARGGLVDEAVAQAALQAGKLDAVCFDVFSSEPPGDLSIFETRGFIGTAHIGGSSDEAVLAMGRAAIAGLREARDPLSFIQRYGC
jgi:D-3-phosphoglycerate dehydrogenase